MAVTDRAAAQHGISAFIIEKGTPGFRFGKKENKLGMRASDTGEVIFTDCRLPRCQMLGKQGEGFVDSLRVLDGGRISIAALSVGMAQGAYDAALQVLQVAEAVWPADLGVPGHPAETGRMAMDLDAARLLNYRAAWMLDHGHRVTRGILHGQAVRI